MSHCFNVHSVIPVLRFEQRIVRVDQKLFLGLLFLIPPLDLDVVRRERLAGRVGPEDGSEAVPHILEVALDRPLEVDDIDALEEGVVEVGGDKLERRVDDSSVPRDVQTVAVAVVLVVFLQSLRQPRDTMMMLLASYSVFLRKEV